MDVKFHKAQPTVDPVESVNIIIDEEIPDIKSLSQQDDFCFREATDLENALYFSLPGATYDRLFSAMCIRKESHFRVRHDEPQNVPGLLYSHGITAIDFKTWAKKDAGTTRKRFTCPRCNKWVEAEVSNWDGSAVCPVCENDILIGGR